MKERPILFTGPMVRAILADRKTQTRRIVKPQPVPFGVSSYKGTRQGWQWKPDTLNRSWNDDDQDPYNLDPAARAAAALTTECPHGLAGDRLWVRETFHPAKSCRGPASYRATWPKDDEPPEEGWTPPIFMPRWASRITLEIVKVRVERLRDISNEDCFAEGLPADTTKGNRTWYGDLWEVIHGPGSWALNPWVWVVEFKRV